MMAEVVALMICGGQGPPPVLRSEALWEACSSFAFA
jgi:hypothetical protein